MQMQQLLESMCMKKTHQKIGMGPLSPWAPGQVPIGPMGLDGPEFGPHMNSTPCV